MSTRPTPYAQRILRYCAEHNIEVPNGFHGRSAESYVLIDTSTQPNKLVAVTSHLESWVIDYLSAAAEGRTFRILDFKRGHEVAYDGTKKLKPVGTFKLVDFNEPLERS